MINLPVTEYQLSDKIVNTINTRELYSELGLGKNQYSRWIKLNLFENLYFTENIDFIRVRHNVEGNEVITGFVTIDTAKHLAMVSRSKKAFDIRNYFIKIENEFRLISHPTKPEHSTQKIENELSAIQKYFDTHQNLNQFRKDEMLKSLYEKLGLETCYFPKPIFSNLSFSLTSLLEKFGIQMTAQELNQKLAKLNLIEKRFLDDKKYLWFILEDGEKFGKNIDYLDRTTPRYFENRFQELLELALEK